jgi:hypothetical protein
MLAGLLLLGPFGEVLRGEGRNFWEEEAGGAVEPGRGCPLAPFVLAALLRGVA